MWIDVAFSGGGVKAFAFPGAIEVLEQAGFQFKRTAGTSAGAIVAALLASGYTSEEVKKVMETMEPGKLLDSPERIRFPFYRWLRVYFKMGIFSGHSLENWLKDLFAAKGVTQFSDLPPGALRVVVSDLSKGKMAVLPDDLKDYGIDPGSFSVARAVRMSAGLPFFFEPVSLYDGNGERSLMVDGGILSNFPIWIFDDEEKVLPVRPFLGLQTIDDEEIDRIPKKIKNAADMFRGLFSAMHEAHDKKTISKLKGSNILFIPVKHIETKDFDITRNEREQLYKLGADQARKFLKKWTY
ncbi:hypothetical protein EWI07_09885 [Sporolactobacillus sp. THM7-4]|nr:hypothetical protein EWI07_09885 [Sporolactobacillus sp. THM7-4]